MIFITLNFSNLHLEVHNFTTCSVKIFTVARQLWKFFVPNIFAKVTFMDKHLINNIVENPFKEWKNEKILIKEATTHKETKIKT